MTTSAPIDFDQWLRENAATLLFPFTALPSFPPYKHQRPTIDLGGYSVRDNEWATALNEREDRLATAREVFTDLLRRLKMKDNLLNEQADLLGERDSEIEQLRSDIKTLRDQGAFGEQSGRLLKAERERRDYWKKQADSDNRLRIAITKDRDYLLKDVERLTNEVKTMAKDRDYWRWNHSNVARRTNEIRETKKAFAAKAREAERKADELQDEVDWLRAERVGDNEFLGKLKEERHFQGGSGCRYRVLRDGTLEWRQGTPWRWTPVPPEAAVPKPAGYTYYETALNYWRVNAAGKVEAYAKQGVDKWEEVDLGHQGAPRASRQITFNDLSDAAKAGS